jgi:hypothetical protein
MAHPRGGDRQRTAASAPPGRLGDLQAQVKLALSAGQALPGRGLQQLQLHLVMGRAEVLYIPRPAPRRMDDLYRRRTRRGLHRPHIRGYQPSLEPGLVRNFSDREQRTRRPAARRRFQDQIVAKVGFEQELKGGLRSATARRALSAHSV